LRDGNAEALLEPPPFFDRQRRRARCEEAKRRQVVAMRLTVTVKQDVDRGRIAGGDGDAMLTQMREEAAGGKFLRHYQCGTTVDRHQCAEQLRRRPVKRAEVIQPIVGR
jgi:hypothetical protein